MKTANTNNINTFSQLHRIFSTTESSPSISIQSGNTTKSEGNRLNWKVGDALDKRILILALPAAVLNNAILPLVGAADTIWVGRMKNALTLAGQGAANQVPHYSIKIINSNIAHIVCRIDLLAALNVTREFAYIYTYKFIYIRIGIFFRALDNLFPPIGGGSVGRQGSWVRRLGGRAGTYMYVRLYVRMYVWLKQFYTTLR